jgi:putative endonuclease
MDASHSGTNERALRGAAAEDLAAAYLRLRGCDIIGRNVRVGGGEIDLIARRGEWVLLVEVRYREGGEFGTPIETIRGRKARAMARAARAWICRNGDAVGCWRIDAITVTLDSLGDATVRHFPCVVPLQ